MAVFDVRMDAEYYGEADYCEYRRVNAVLLMQTRSVGSVRMKLWSMTQQRSEWQRAPGAPAP